MQLRLLGKTVLLFGALACVGPAQARAEPDLDRGAQLAARGDVVGALAVYRDVVQARPDLAEGHARLGGMQLMNQQYADAVHSFQRAVSLGDGSAAPFVGMGMAYLHMGQYGPARAAFDEAKNRGSAHTQDIDRLLSWLDARDPPALGTHP